MERDMQEIRNLEDKYGIAVFGMALSHLVDVGARNLDEDIVAVCIAEIMASDSQSVMSPRLQCGILECASELAKYSAWRLFNYIKKHLFVTSPAEHIPIMTKAKFDGGCKVLIDNGICEGDAVFVMQALCYVLFDEETEQFMEEYDGR